MPHRDDGLFRAFIETYRGRWTASLLGPWGRALVDLVESEAATPRDPVASLEDSLRALGVEALDRERFLLETALALKAGRVWFASSRFVPIGYRCGPSLRASSSSWPCPRPARDRLPSTSALTGIAVLRMYFALFSGRSLEPPIALKGSESFGFVAVAAVLVLTGLVPAPLVASRQLASGRILVARAALALSR